MIIDFKQIIYSYNTFIKDSKLLAKQYKNILKYITIGNSHDNRDIVLLKLGKGKIKIIITAGVHGRESINTIVIMKIIEDLASIYKKDKDNILNKFTFYIIPMLNPDGYMIALNGFDEINELNLRMKCKKFNIAYPEWKYNARGVDINRNFPSKLWNANDINDFIASEKETKALIYAFKKYKSTVFFDIHSRGKEIYYYRSVMSNKYNMFQLYIAMRIEKAIGYKLVKPKDEIDYNDSGGNTVHYFSEYFIMPALTIETINNEETFPLDISLREETYNELNNFIYCLDDIFI
ncbi:MAG TPA: hypothetical protein GXZ90_10890 [Clostridiales bacterium]|nr:hypothetical protein [Clostridiales bacterium]